MMGLCSCGYAVRQAETLCHRRVASVHDGLVFMRLRGKGDGDSVLAPYWAVDFAKDEEKPNMDLKWVCVKLLNIGEVSGVGVSALTLVTQRGQDGNGKLYIQALTNTKRVKEGDILLRKDT